MSSPVIQFAGAYEPKQATTGAAGYDLKAHHIEIEPNVLTIRTGIRTAIPTGWVGLVLPRSSLGIRGFQLLNTVGVIDSDYRGELVLKTTTTTPIRVGDRVAQLVVVPHLSQAVMVDELPDTMRGVGGFGSTGK